MANCKVVCVSTDDNYQLRPEAIGDTWAVTVERNEAGYLELYESALPAAESSPRGISRACRTDDWQYSLY